jgi:hypothetical protein
MEAQESSMHRKFSLIAGTALTATLFVFFHAVLALGTICWIVFLIPAMLFKWMDDGKAVPVQSVSNGRRRL